MLGKEKENDRVKVDRYWPEEEEPPLSFYHLQVALVGKKYDPELSIAERKLLLTYEDPQDKSKTETRTVMHYQYEGWPDHGVPPSAAPIRHLVHMIESERSSRCHSYTVVVVFYYLRECVGYYHNLLPW